ncbi:hypothetical protein L6R53_12720 [Myxococcota bacterium]|nr:hypothetical protein [Myxococcota bacterium]
MGSTLLILGLFLACEEDSGPATPPPAMTPPPPKEEAAPVEEAPPAQTAARPPQWGDGTTELRRSVATDDGAERDYLVGVSWTGPDAVGQTVEQRIIFRAPDLLAAGPERKDESLDGILSTPHLVPSYEDGADVGPHVKVSPFVRCEVVDERTSCRPCDALTDDPTLSRVCFADQAAFQAGIWQALADRLGLPVDQVQAIPHQVATSAPIRVGDFAVDVCAMGAADVTEYQVRRNDRVLKDTRLIALSHAAITADGRVVRQVVSREEAGFPHHGGLLVQTTGFLPLMAGNDQVPGPYGVEQWCQAAAGWCAQLDDGCEYSLRSFSFAGSGTPTPLSASAPAPTDPAAPAPTDPAAPAPTDPAAPAAPPATPAG